MPDRFRPPRLGSSAAARPARTLAGLFLALAMFSVAIPAAADARLWDGDGSRVPSGNFHVATNWIGNVVPAASDGALFRVGAAATYAVTFVGVPDVRPVSYQTDYLRVGSNTVTFQNTFDASYVVTNPTTAQNARGVIVGELSGEFAVLNTTMPIVAVAATLGDGGGATGTLNINAQSLTLTGAADAPAPVLIVGNHGAGRLNIINGASVRLAGGGASTIGYHPGSDGRVTVTGGASWTHAGGNNLAVGWEGAGSLSITTGGRVAVAGSASVGVGGAVAVDGPGSEWVIGTDLSVFGGSGALSVTNGGRVVSGNVELGSDFPQPASAQPARANLAGAGAIWRAGFLRVGGSQAGVVDVTAGGQVVTRGVHVRDGTLSAASRVTVHGAGSTWTNDGSFQFAPSNRSFTAVTSALAVTGGGRIDTTGNLEIGPFATLTIDGPGSAVTAGGRLLLENHAAISVSLLNGGSLTVGGDLSAYVSTFTLDGGTLDLNGRGLYLSGNPTSNSALRAGTVRNARAIFLNGSLHKTGPGTLTLDGATTFAEPTVVSAGTLILKTSHTTGQSLDVADGATARLAQSAAGPGNVVLKTGGVDTHGTGQLDLTDNKLIVANGDLPAIQNLVKVGRNGGAWNGPGIMTSAAAPNTALGVALAQDVGLAGGTFGGVTVVAGDVLVMYTLAADSDLDGRVDFNDLVRLAQNYNQSGRDWPRGDFNFDGQVDFADLVRLAQNYNQALPAPVPGAPADFANDLAAAFASVPEPGTTLFLVYPACGLAGLRHRRGRRVRA